MSVPKHLKNLNAAVRDLGSTPDELFELWLIKSKTPDLIRLRLDELYNRAKTGTYINEDNDTEVLTPWDNHSAMAVDLLDDVVVVWLDSYIGGTDTDADE